METPGTDTPTTKVLEQPWKKYWPPQADSRPTDEELEAKPWLTWKPDPDNPNEKPWYTWMNDPKYNPNLLRNAKTDPAQQLSGSGTPPPNPTPTPEPEPGPRPEATIAEGG
ncbi:hypothetical protein K440DRAFT_660562 [Wilcoxina mikolae CBS 423.85]|nr:hypothetical protein K440DRAFT_660562 [Wilcoxina mikolae CBS 423.85]